MYCRKNLIRVLTALLCVTLLLVGGGPLAAAEPAVYFTAVGYTILPLADGAMPITSGVTLYAPHRVFTNGTGIFSSIMYQPHYLSLFGPNRSLTFDIERSVSFDQDRMYSDALIYRGGTYYVPVDAVCEYFGLTYAVLDTAYGKLLRIRLPSTAQDDAAFLNAAADTLERRYREYVNPPTPTPAPTPTPGSMLPAAPPPVVSPTPTPTPTPTRVVYLTFDDGPKRDGSTERILDTLTEYDVRATFFLLGTNMHVNEDSIRRMVGTGHAIGLHSYTHKREEFYASPEAMIDELTRTNDALYEAAMIRTRLVRTPYGSHPYLTPELRETMSDNGYRFWDWNVDPQDSVGKPTKEGIYAAAVEGLEKTQKEQKPAVVLLHDKHTTADTLPMLLDYLVAQGYTFRVITESEPPTNFFQYIK